MIFTRVLSLLKIILFHTLPSSPLYKLDKSPSIFHTPNIITSSSSSLPLIFHIPLRSEHLQKPLFLFLVLTSAHLSSSDPPATTSTSSDPESSMKPSVTAAVADQIKKDQVIDLEKYAKDNRPFFQMTDDKPVMEQIHEYENLVANVLSEGMKMCEILQANVLLEKFPPSWNDYRYKSYQCNQRKGRPSQKPTPQANLAEQDNEIIPAIVEANLIENKTDWILNAGASRHFCTNRELLHDYEDIADGECVFMGNSATTGMIGKGKVILKLTSGKTLSLSNVLYVPSIRRNLVSKSLLNRVGLKIVLEVDKVVLTKNGEFVGNGYLSNGLFVLNTISMNANASSSAYVIESVNLWHGRLGHVNFASNQKLKDLRLINTSESHETDKCPICVESKFHKKPFKPVETRTTNLLELIHSDLADFKNTTSRGGKNYYVSFVDDYSRFTKIYLIKTKDEAGSMFLKFKAESENQLGKKIKRLRSDRCGEYSDKTLKDFCESNDIIHEFTAPYSQQQNGIAERKNRTLKEMMNAMLLSSGLSDNMRGEAVLFACFVLNRIPQKRLYKTPYEL
ncbi:ty1-copia retrotransposon protein [Cucumis melo var. makuwa]|uniref:Ty1-copia retrotransposon protein n=1 Tax=Cucumis melo var. makuwa TaxID=1194695 RepID=A0A5A7V2H1_CUCMM|nr:ty1-copia retrotransposon protein [Cucumis melo var. makuwa]